MAAETKAVETKQFVTAEEIEAVVDRATRLRVTMAELVEMSGFNRSTFWRWKKEGRAPMISWRAVEAKLNEMERQAA